MPRFQKNSLVPIVDIFFQDLVVLDVVLSWSLIADSLLLHVPGLGSLPREFHDRFVSPT